MARALNTRHKAFSSFQLSLYQVRGAIKPALTLLNYIKGASTEALEKGNTNNMASRFDGKLLWSQGGNSSEEVWETEFDLWTSLLLTHTGLDNEMDTFMDYFLPITRPDVILKGATLSLGVPKGTKKGKNRNILTFACGKQGTRVLGNNYIPTELALGLLFKKDSETMGTPGHTLLRGSLVSTDLKMGKDGFYVLADNFDYTAATTFCNNMTNDPDAAFRVVLPAKGQDNHITGTRNIHKWSCVGLGRKDLRNNRKTKKEKIDAAAREEVVELAKEIAASIGEGFSIPAIIKDAGLIVRFNLLVGKYGALVVSKITQSIIGADAYATLIEGVPALEAVAPLALAV